MDNYHEYVAGTNPTNAASVLKAGAVARTNVDMVLTFQTQPGVDYRVLKRGDILFGSWGILADQIIGSGGAVQITDPGAALQPRAFYQLQALP